MTRSCTTAVPVTPGPSMSVTSGVAVDDVEDLLDDQADAAAVLGVDDDLQRVAVPSCRAPVSSASRRAIGRMPPRYCSDLADRRPARGWWTGQLFQPGDPLHAGSPDARPSPTRTTSSWSAAATTTSSFSSPLPLAPPPASDEAAARRRGPSTSRIIATPSVAEDRHAGVLLDRLEVRRQRLDDDLLGVDDVVDDQAELPVLVAEDRDEPAAVVAEVGAGRPSTSRSETSGSRLSRSRKTGRAGDVLDARWPARRPRGGPARAGSTCGNA